MSFQSGDWALVGDKEVAHDLTEEQKAICEQISGEKLFTTIWCDEEKEEYKQICETVRVFPTLCNVKTSQCYGGLNRTKEELNSLK